MSLASPQVEAALDRPTSMQSPGVVSTLPVVLTPPRARITFIAATPDLFGAYISYLQDDGYTVALMASVSDASTEAEVHCPDLVFLDLGQSSRAGLEMVRELKGDG